MDATAKQQVVEKVKQATNILVTVSKNPSVDQLAACIGLTLFLNKVGKHATAVFSGAVPSTIEFLQPEKTISTNTDNLRDFIISLDKEKADKLRYKVEDNFVRIYITPYRTSLTEKDLKFSQGEVNVDLVLALGVTDQAQLDGAITAHGKILHDAVVISVNASAVKTGLGQVNWQEPTSSSLSEMIVSISEAFGSNLLDGQMATAFLTGIVASTNRFGNDKTSPKVMTMAAQLMAAGANQQLIITQLEPQLPPEPPKAEQPPPLSNKKLPDSPKMLGHDEKGTLNVKHGAGGADQEEVEINSNEINIDTEGNLKRAAEAAAAKVNSTPAEPADVAPEAAPAKEAANPPATTPEIVLPPESPSPSQSPPAEPPTKTEAGGHHLISSTLPGSLATAPDEWASREQDAPDLLSEDQPATGEILDRGHDVAPPEEQARSAVEQAYKSAGDAPVTTFDPPPSPNQNQAPPPPFPPPITLNQGVVIPPPYNPGPANSQNSK